MTLSITVTMPAPKRTDKLPCGRFVDPGAPKSMRDEHHTPDVIEERIAWQRERYAVGMLVQRDDGCLVRIDCLREPTNGGYIYASGRCIDKRTGEARGYSYETGPLTTCAVVTLAAEVAA